eukprot:3340059-Pyramimonas_sp.AAC.1
MATVLLCRQVRARTAARSLNSSHVQPGGPNEWCQRSSSAREVPTADCSTHEVLMRPLVGCWDAECHAGCASETRLAGAAVP